MRNLLINNIKKCSQKDKYLASSSKVKNRDFRRFIVNFNVLIQSLSKSEVYIYINS